jgi:diguanylate cyclase (GGDEF)-like protein
MPYAKKSHNARRPCGAWQRLAAAPVSDVSINRLNESIGSIGKNVRRCPRYKSRKIQDSVIFAVNSYCVFNFALPKGTQLTSAMKVDLTTLYLLAIGTLLASSAMTYWEHLSHPKRGKELRMLSAGYAALALGCAAAAFRTELFGPSSLIGAAISNLAILSGYLVLMHGVAMFNGRGRRYLTTSIILFALMALTWAVAGGRWLVAVWAYACAVPITVASGITCFELMRMNRMPAFQSRRVAVAVTGIHALFYAARAVVLPWLVPVFGMQVLAVSGVITMYEGVLYSVILPMTLLRLTREEIHGELLQESRTDYLTRLGNRKLFFEEGERAIRDNATNRRPITLLAFDLDQFKKINDRYGHKAGDQVLRSFADTARIVMEDEAILARIGGEEFAALLPGYDSDRAKRVGETVAKRFSATLHSADGERIHATVSIGLAEAERQGTALTDLLSAADKALYRAKSLGGNRLEQAGAEGLRAVGGSSG